MNKRLIDELTQAALDCLEAGTPAILEENNSAISGKFNGYVSSLASSLSQASLLPVILFFAQPSEQAGKRHLLMELIFNLLKKKSAVSGDQPLIGAGFESLLDYVRNPATDRHRAKTNIITAAIACKNAFRAYRQIKERT